MHISIRRDVFRWIRGPLNINYLKQLTYIIQKYLKTNFIQMSNQELQNRKILEELQLQKSQLKLQNNLPQENKNEIQSSPSPNQQGLYKQINEFGQLNPAQRTALQLAYSSSYGYYVPQDSQFGNYILPVIPRYDQKK